MFSLGNIINQASPCPKHEATTTRHHIYNEKEADYAVTINLAWSDGAAQDFFLFLILFLHD